MNCFKHTIRSKSPMKIVGMLLFGGIAIIGFAALFGFITMWLWNALIPEIFGLAVITYWQAVGLLILFKILFGGFGSGGNKSKKKEKMTMNRTHKSDLSKWGLYDQFWKEEGDAAYKDYIRRKENPAAESSDIEMEPKK